MLQKFWSYTKISAPVYAFLLLIDRWYQYHRFGSFFTTYVSLFARNFRELNPSLPSNYPWETPFHVGFLGPLITPEKSIFLFDPLIILTLLDHRVLRGGDFARKFALAYWLFFYCC